MRSSRQAPVTDTMV